MLVIAITNNASLLKLIQHVCAKPILSARYCAGYWGHKCEQDTLPCPKEGDS